MSLEESTLSFEDEFEVMIASLLQKEVPAYLQGTPYLAEDCFELLKEVYASDGSYFEIETIMREALSQAKSSRIELIDLPANFLAKYFYKSMIDEENMMHLSYQEAKKRALNNFHQSYMIALLRRTSGNLTAAADLAGLDRSNFKKILEKYKISHKTN